MLQGFDKGFHPVQALFQLLVGVAVAQADIALRAEAAAGDGGHLALGDHPGAELGGSKAEPGDVREHIEGTLRLREGKAHLP